MRRKNVDDFIGFTYNDKHSSELGILRVSDGSRYNNNLLPNIQDKTVPVPGGDGFYYFGSQYTNKDFIINFAFDDLLEEELHFLSYWLGDREIHELIFDETPYKKYMVKPSAPPTINYICFDEDGRRVYKGEGQISFTSFVPYAINVYKDLRSCPYRNKREWGESSGLLDNLNNYNQPFSINNKVMYLYNPGDFESDFKLYLIGNQDVSGRYTLSDLTFILKVADKNGEKIKKEIGLRPINLLSLDQGIVIDTRLNIVEGIKKNEKGNYVRTGNLYNEYLNNGTFFKIPSNLIFGSRIQHNSIQGEKPLSDLEQKITLEYTGELTEGKIEYNYLYF